MPSKPKPRVPRIRTPMTAEQVTEVVQAVKRSDVQTPERSNVRGLIERPGRVLSDGSRRGARSLRRLTIYVSLDMGAALDTLASARSMSKSEIAEAAFNAYLTEVTP